MSYPRLLAGLGFWTVGQKRTVRISVFATGTADVLSGIQSLRQMTSQIFLYYEVKTGVWQCFPQSNARLYLEET
jgi:hypothetical protein